MTYHAQGEEYVNKYKEKWVIQQSYVAINSNNVERFATEGLNVEVFKKEEKRRDISGKFWKRFCFCKQHNGTNIKVKWSHGM